jgi:uncharacterized membrane protein
MSDLTPSGLTDNAAGGIAYLTCIPAILFLLIEPYNKNPYVRFHAWQSILLSVTAFLLSIVLGFALMFTLLLGPFVFLTISRLIWLAWFIVWLLCLINAFNGKRYKLPLLGDLAEKQANR